MDYKQIEDLKYILSNAARQGCTVRIPVYEIEGRLVGVGYKPFWTNPSDSKIDKLELNIMDNLGRIVPFNFHYVIGYDIVHQDNRKIENCSEISIDIHVYSQRKTEDEDAEERVHMDVTVRQVKQDPNRKK